LAVVIGKFYLESDEPFLFETKCDIRERRDPVENAANAGQFDRPHEESQRCGGRDLRSKHRTWKRSKGKRLRVDLDNGRTAIVVLDFSEPGPIYSARSYFV
jgi:hypothetical protein